MLKAVADIELVRQFQSAQQGVFFHADLKNMCGERHPAALGRRIQALEHANVLCRFIKGVYVTPSRFNLEVLSQRIAPTSYISFGPVLARALVVGPTFERETCAVKVGRSRVYEGAGHRIVHRGVQASLLFGYAADASVLRATVEKALLDTLYFHLRGVRYPFDIYSDLRLDKIDKNRIVNYLEKYQNKKFVSFVEGLLHGYL